jgi:hypothetical protein
LRLGVGSVEQNLLLWPCHSVGPDGSMVLCSRYTSQLWFYRYAMREQWAPPRNAIPMPTIVDKKQRPNSPLVDIDYMVTDADDTNVTTAMLIFTNSSVTPSLASCIRNPTFVEGTATNLGPGIAANEVRRLTWNAGADWSVNLGQYRLAILARDRRPRLLDIHYINLLAEHGMPSLKISRSPLNPNDFMQVWWWLLGTNDVGISLSSNRIYGVSGAYSGKVLCEDSTTSPDGRAYLFTKMAVREATTQEVQWAKQASMPVGTNPNQWSPGRSVGERPAAVNEYGFDTGGWDTASCFWVVPLN